MQSLRLPLCLNDQYQSVKWQWNWSQSGCVRDTMTTNLFKQCVVPHLYLCITVVILCYFLNILQSIMEKIINSWTQVCYAKHANIRWPRLRRNSSHNGENWCIYSHEAAQTGGGLVVRLLFQDKWEQDAYCIEQSTSVLTENPSNISVSTAGGAFAILQCSQNSTVRVCSMTRQCCVLGKHLGCDTK